jgi:hypothetical protein
LAVRVIVQATKGKSKPGPQGREPKASNILDDSDSDGGGGGGGGPSLSINRGFATAYEERKRKQELGKAREMGLLQGGWDDGEEGEEEDESTSESEDEGEALTPFVDVEIMRTIHMIRSKDPRVYDPNTKFYRGAEEAEGASSDEGEGEGAGKAKGKKGNGKVRPRAWARLVHPLRVRTQAPQAAPCP